ncbi:MAG TPA: hypothetical protein VFA87_11220 [Rhizomicrobium sp.]|nr:hypothetical protein [Rhizomicrobium sp.]
MVRNFGQTVPLEKPANTSQQPPAAASIPAPKAKPGRFGLLTLVSGVLCSLFWIAVTAAYAVGFWGLGGILELPLATKAAVVGGMLMPPIFFMAIAAALARSMAMSEAARQMLAASDRLFTADEVAADKATRLARVVRRELDGLNSGLDAAFQRMRTLEAVLEKQIATLDDAGARAQVRGDTISARLNQESARIESLGDLLTDAAGRAGESVAGRAAQLRAMMESAEGTLKMATQSLDVQAAGFRAAITSAAESPLEAAKSLEVQASRIEEVSDAAMSRAEFVLARQEKHRAQMSELVEKLKTEGENFEAALSQQRTGMEGAIRILGGEAKKFEMVTGDAERHLEAIMSNAASRAAQLTQAFAREAEHLKDTSEAASQVLASLATAVKDAGEGAKTLIGESAAQAKHDARLLVGEAMAECDRLLRTAGEMSAEAAKMRTLLSDTSRDLEKHLMRLPGLAQEEARRVRQLVSSETEQILDLSARALSTVRARATGKPPDSFNSGAGPMKPQAEPESDGLKGLARKLTSRKPAAGKPEAGKGEGTKWEMKTLLAAVDESELQIPPPRIEKAGVETAATLGALQLALADMAIDLSQLDESEPGDEDWKRYLAGDRAVFARRLADAIDETAVDRITTLYRDDKRFHDAADAYLAEFETLLNQAKQGDSGGILTSTLLSADTGKVYLAIAYALGRL